MTEMKSHWHLTGRVQTPQGEQKDGIAVFFLCFKTGSASVSSFSHQGSSALPALGSCTAGLWGYCCADSTKCNRQQITPSLQVEMCVHLDLNVTSNFQQRGKLSENPLHVFSQMCVLVFVSVLLPTKEFVYSGKALGSHLQMVFIVCLF